MVKVKICGMRRSEDIESANRLRPDYIGFVFAESRRQISASLAASLRQQLAPGILAVGVFVNENPDQIAALCDNGIIDLVQLHGDEDEAYLTQLKKRIHKPVIKAVRVKSVADVLSAADSACDYLLLDSYSKSMYGGSGQEFDLRLIPELKKPFFLAGGVNPENVRDKIAACSPYAIDASSGVEGEDGYKSYDKMKRLIDEVREG